MQSTQDVSAKPSSNLRPYIVPMSTTLKRDFQGAPRLPLRLLSGNRLPAQTCGPASIVLRITPAPSPKRNGNMGDNFCLCPPVKLLISEKGINHEA